MPCQQRSWRRKIMETIKSKLEQLQIEIKDQLSILSGLKSKEFELKVQLFTQKTGIALNDKVTYMDGRQRKHGQVTSFRNGCADVQAIVTLFNKDGKLGSRVVHIWNDSKLEKLS